MFGVQVTTHPKQSFEDSAVCRSRMSVCKRLSDLVLCAGWNMVKQMNTMEYDETWRSMKKYEDMFQKIYISQNSPQNWCLFNRRALNFFKVLKVTDMRTTLRDAIFLLMLYTVPKAPNIQRCMILRCLQRRRLLGKSHNTSIFRPWILDSNSGFNLHF